MFCSKCGKGLNEEDRFCPYCGAEQHPNPVKESLTPPLKKVSSEANNATQQIYHEPISKPKKKGKGCLIVLSIIGGIFILLVVLAMLNGGEVNYSSAKIVEAVIASQIEEGTFKPLTPTKVFQTDALVIYTVVHIKNAPPDTQVIFKWKYLDENIDITDFKVQSTESEQWIESHLTPPNNGWPVGKYQVEVYINEELKQTLDFSIE